ncbi:hypothetical protein Bca101_060839 [Brassica carinata]
MWIWISHYLVELLQENNYKLFLAYSFRPSKMSFLLTSAEWLWESLLAAGPLSHPLLFPTMHAVCLSKLYSVSFLFTFPQVQRIEDYFLRSV